jgi:serine protease Do
VSTLGLTVSDLSEAQKRDLKVRNGVRIDAVDAVAARAGLREGDLILSIDNVEVTSAKQFEATVAKLDKSRPVSVLARRGDAVNFFILRPQR